MLTIEWLHKEQIKNLKGGKLLAFYRVIKSRKAESENPIKVVAGEEVKCIEESDPNGDWGSWILCKSEDNSGWIPKQIIKKEENHGVILEDYNVVEFNLEVGELIVSLRTLNGWIWGYKKEEPNNEAWAPLNHIEIIE